MTVDKTGKADPSTAPGLKQVDDDVADLNDDAQDDEPEVSTHRGLVDITKQPSEDIGTQKLSESDQEQLNQLLTDKDTAKHSHPQNFFNNQAFKSQGLVFDDQFYGDNWKTLLSKQMAKTFQETVKLHIVENIETYEPKQVSEEISQTIEVERQEFLQHQKETKEEISIFSVPDEKGFIRFKKLFGFTDNDGEIENNFQKFSFPAFDVRGCQQHRNAIELFSYAQKFFIVTKSFSHATGNSRLTMTIWKFEPTEGDERGSVERLQRVEWPIVDQSACFDASMISVIQWNQFLYYFKVENQLNDPNPRADVVFQLCKYDMLEEQETLVREFPFYWGKEQWNDDMRSVNSRTPAGNLGTNTNIASSLVQEKTSAYSAIFLKVDSEVCETEEDFINRRMLALVFQSSQDSRDQTFIFKIRKLSNFDQDLFFNKQPIPCSTHFKFQYFMEDSQLKCQAFALIYTQRVMIVPVQLSDDTEVTHKEMYHYEGVDCQCCTEQKRAIATSLKNEFLENFKILDSYNYGWGEEYRSMNIKKKHMACEMIKYLEKDDQIKINQDNDCVQLTFDKRKHRYIFMFNIQSGEYKDDLVIYESSLMTNIRNTYKYDPEDLHPLVKYCYHDRPLFLEEQGIENKDFFIQKQLFPYYNNVIAELRVDNEGQNQIIVAYEQPETDEKEKTMHISIDDAQMFMNVFHGIQQESKIQFLQLAKDDRMILPRVVKDEERRQIIFQLFDYRDMSKEQEEEELVEVDEDGIAIEEESEDEAQIQARKLKEQERKRVKVEIPLDLSTANLNLDRTNIFMQPCTSVYRQQFGQEGNELVQDFQVCVYMNGCQMCRIFQYRVFWSLKKKKDWNEGKDPYNVRATLVGLKMLIFRPNDTKEPIGFYPLLDDFSKIFGTQLIFRQKYVVNLPNFERDEWVFATDVAMSGYKIYYNYQDLDEDVLLLQSNLSEVLNIREEFNEADHTMLLKYQIRYLMNMVPFMLDQYLMFDLNYSNFLQPLELLNGQSCCDIMLHDPAYLQKTLKQVLTEEIQQKSLFEFFIKELDEEERAALFAEDYYIPDQVEVCRDPVSMNPLLRCFHAEPIFYGSVERILAYMFGRPYSKNQSMIFMEVMPHMLSQSQPSNEFAKFFIDSPNAELNFGKIGSRFTIILNHPDLPQYTNKKITIFEFEDELSVGTQTDVQQWMTDFIINQKELGKNSQIPVRHYYVDFRIQNLGKKLNQFKRGEDIDTSTISDFEVSQQLYKICLIYGKDIEFQDGTRNIIDDTYESISYIYSIQFGLFLFGYALPLFLSVFVMESPNLQLACNIISLMTMCLFFIYSVIQLLTQGKQFFKQGSNINDIIIFIFFAIYLGIRLKESRNYLPEYILRDGGITFDAPEEEEGARRLAKGGAGGGSGGGSGGGGSGGGGSGGGSNGAGATTGGSIYGESTATPPSDFEGSWLADFLDFNDRKIWRVAFLGFLHLVLLITGTIKTIAFLKIYSGFQELILVIQSCLWKIAPFSILIYFWIFIVACLFRILGADNGDTVVPEGEEYQETYRFYGPWYHYTFNTYRQALGDPQPFDYMFWQDAYENYPEAARFMSGLIWLLWLVNQYMILIFALNFMVSIITQSYEESLNQSTIVRYTFRCERVMEASILTKFFGAARTLQTFSLSTNNSTHLDFWPGFVQSIKLYVRGENIALRQALADSVNNLNNKIDSKTKGLEDQIKDLSKKMTNVNEHITEKLDFMTDKFEEIKDIIRAQIEDQSEFNIDDIQVDKVDSNVLTVEKIEDTQ